MIATRASAAPVRLAFCQTSIADTSSSPVSTGPKSAANPFASAYRGRGDVVGSPSLSTTAPVLTRPVRKVSSRIGSRVFAAYPPTLNGVMISLTQSTVAGKIRSRVRL